MTNETAAWCIGLLPEVEAIAAAAGELILRVYRSDFTVQAKADRSPLTAADEGAEALITPALRALTPELAVVAEEACARGEAPTVGRRFWLVDPLDGTREFVARNGEFTVNIALIEDAAPVLGVLLVPALGRCYLGVPGQGAWVVEGGARQRIGCRTPPAVGATVVASRAHGAGAEFDAWLAGTVIAERVTAGSALKFGLLASGQVDIYPRFGRTMEWDTAAGQAILIAAGGQVRDLRGQPLRYGKPGFENPSFVARGREH